MTLREFETKRLKKLVAQFIEKLRVPAHIAANSTLLSTVKSSLSRYRRFVPSGKRAARLEHSVAKSTDVKAKGNWKVFLQKFPTRPFRPHGWKETPVPGLR